MKKIIEHKKSVVEACERGTPEIFAPEFSADTISIDTTCIRKLISNFLERAGHEDSLESGKKLAMIVAIYDKMVIGDEIFNMKIRFNEKQLAQETAAMSTQADQGYTLEEEEALADELAELIVKHGGMY